MLINLADLLRLMFRVIDVSTIPNNYYNSAKCPFLFLPNSFTVSKGTVFYLQMSDK